MNVTDTETPVEKWSTLKFLKGFFFNKYFIAWTAAFIFALCILWRNANTDIVNITLIVTWGVISVIWMLSEAWKKFIENGQLKVDANIGASLKVDGAIDKVVDAVKK
jgi:hypothetical protein